MPEPLDYQAPSAPPQGGRGDIIASLACGGIAAVLVAQLWRSWLVNPHGPWPCGTVLMVVPASTYGARAGFRSLKRPDDHGGPALIGAVAGFVLSAVAGGALAALLLLDFSD